MIAQFLDFTQHPTVFWSLFICLTDHKFTCTGLTIFKGIRAFDRDKPNTPNSDVQYSIIAGDSDGHFALESSHKPALVLKKPLDYDTGDKEFLLVITASVSKYHEKVQSKI